MTDRVSAQYEAYPYPQRLPQDDKSRLIEGSPSHLKEVDHYVFGGRLIAGERRERGPLRVLVAGGGTGDALIMLGQHLADALVLRAAPAKRAQLHLAPPEARELERRAHVAGEL